MVNDINPGGFGNKTYPLWSTELIEPHLTLECSSCTLPMKTFTSRWHTFCSISITEEKRNGRFACKYPTWIIIKKNYPPRTARGHMEKKRLLKIDLAELSLAMEDNS
jgi:hypothetical protein